ncbi:MAG: hypothetical protein IPP82_12370 [Xanthomonadales bacterium]|nr:hypothetical protein [Xanthomonadales bacterium]
MPRFALYSILATFCLGALVDSGTQAQERSSGQYLVLAIAVDVQSAVLRDPSGNTHLYGIGDLLPGGQWRVISASSFSLELQAADRLHGSVVNLRLRAGDAFDPQTLSASLQREGEPLYGAERMVQRKTAKSSPERN